MSVALRRISPGVFVPAVFAANAVLLLLDWVLVPAAPRAAGVLVYLQVSGVGPLLGSGFWLIATERFDPHTAKRRFGQIAGAGTAGGLVGGLVAERVGAIFGVAATLLLLAVANLYCAWIIRRLAASEATPTPTQVGDVSPDLAAQTPRSGLLALREAPYLQNLAFLVLLGALGASLADYLFKSQAVASTARPPVDLPRARRLGISSTTGPGPTIPTIFILTSIGVNCAGAGSWRRGSIMTIHAGSTASTCSRGRRGHSSSGTTCSISGRSWAAAACLPRCRVPATSTSSSGLRR
jgi:hypothetical protein